MNRAAERAAPAAKKIFWDAIGGMTIDDARGILDGTPTAATDYFKSKTTEHLTAAFSPVVHRTMGEVGVTRQYQELFGRALDGLFHVVGEEETRIRTNPGARVTELLREVFGPR
jgi:Protein of unknown function (DUF4197)